MTLDSTARYANVKDSIKKYFVDNLYTTEGLQLLFDKTIQNPDIAENKGINRWLLFNFGPMIRSTVSQLTLDIICATRNDNEGFRLAQLTDTLMGYITDQNTTDGFKRIPFYKSKAVGAWELLGALVVTDIRESATEEENFGIKFKIITCTIKWAAKV